MNSKYVLAPEGSSGRKCSASHRAGMWFADKKRKQNEAVGRSETKKSKTKRKRSKPVRVSGGGYKFLACHHSRDENQTGVRYDGNHRTNRFQNIRY